MALAVLSPLACAAEPEPGPDLGDDPVAYLSDAEYRRAILERDLDPTEPIYAQIRLRYYASGDADDWDGLPVVDWPTAPVTLAWAAELAATQVPPPVEFAPPLSDGFELDALPSSPTEWVALGERVFFEYPMSTAPAIGLALRAGIDLREYGLLVTPGADGEDTYVGLRLLDGGGEPRLAVTCASCHASIGADGRPSGVRANRDYDFGRLRVDFGGAAEPHGVDTTALEDLAALGPGRSDVQSDGVFNPYAFPDFGGIADMPYLHHTANWTQRGVATLAIRIETVFISGTDRPPRVLTWALAEYLRSLPPPPVAEPSPASQRGEAVFAAAGCPSCHTPPLYTSATRVPVDALGTDAAAGTSPVRGTGHWRVPSLRGVGGNAPYLHHGAFPTLEAMFDPDRDEPGHGFGLELGEAERADLLAFLRTI